tara:strand:- start:230 stop:760 length:531 start_codon:yes stop_codon:yes gene_type:complete
MSIYLKDFRQNTIRIKNRIKISKFVPKDLADLIIKNVPENNYILGVTYRTGDNQICISGHPKENETLETGASRELLEELCLKNKNKLNFCHTDNINHFCFIDIKDTEVSHNNKKNDLIDIKDRAVICVHGGEKDILLYLATVKYNLDNSDDIESIWSSSKEKILSFIESGKIFMCI